jgi:hypothetical protein
VKAAFGSAAVKSALRLSNECSGWGRSIKIKPLASWTISLSATSLQTDSFKEGFLEFSTT